MKNRRALVIGATGLTGRHVLPRLLADRRYDDIHVLSRRALPIHDGRLQPHIVDFDHLSSEHAGFQVDHVYCCLGTTIRQAGCRERFHQVDYGYPMMVARAALAAGAATFVVISAMGADPRSSNFYLRTKGELERDLEGLSFRHLVIVRPSLLVGRRETRRFLEGLGMWILPKLTFLMQGPLKPYRAITADTVAGAMHRLAWLDRAGTQVATSAELQILGRIQPELSDG
jgi:uncharacterized protein YbjT (DUF2867 family)